MATLIKRATKDQLRAYRIVYGAVKNVIDAHPEWNIDIKIAASIAKRAAGTLAAEMPRALAEGSQPHPVRTVD